MQHQQPPLVGSDIDRSSLFRMYWRFSISSPATKKEPASTSAPSAMLEASRRRARLQACLCAKAAEDFRGQDTLVLDLTGVTPIVDYFAITTGTSSRQMRALANEVLQNMKQG